MRDDKVCARLARGGGGSWVRGWGGPVSVMRVHSADLTSGAPDIRPSGRSHQLSNHRRASAVSHRGPAHSVTRRVRVRQIEGDHV